MISFMFFACRSKSSEAEEDEDPLGDERNFSATARDIRESDDGMRDEGMGLLEEIKEEILKEEEKAEVEMKKSNYKRLGTWSNITITSSFVQNSEEAPPLSPAEGKVKIVYSIFALYQDTENIRSVLSSLYPTTIWHRALRRFLEE